jgi:hypothetical protein
MSYFPAPSGVWTAIETVTISNDAVIEMDLSGSHKMYSLHIDNLVPITDASFLRLRYSTDLGVSFLSGASDYSWGLSGSVQAGSSVVDGVTAATEILLTRDFLTGLGTATIESFNGFINIHNPNQTANAICMSSNIGMIDSAGNSGGYTSQGALIANLDEVDAIQLSSSDGNLSTGRITLYGLGIS